jgi:small subunit ribosomal protein S5
VISDELLITYHSSLSEGENTLRNVDLEEQEEELETRVIDINRVYRVRKGGRVLSFNALSAVGDGTGTIGVGFGKANEIPAAIGKSEQAAKKNMFKVPVVDGTIPHEVVGHACSTRVLLKPASPGTGIIAGSSVKVILEVAGVRDILSKCFGARNKINVAWAVVDGLKKLKSAEDVAKLRGKTVEEILNW